MFVKPPVNMQCILEPNNGKGGLYIGGIASAQNIQQLDDYRIGAIVSILSRNTLQLPHYINQFFIQAQDNESEQLFDYFEKAGDYIKEARQSTNVLIHCYAGQSRSSTLAIAYLIKHHQLTLGDALSTVQNARRIARPNNGFMKQLSLYEQQLLEKNSTQRSIFHQKYHVRNKSTAHQYKLDQKKFGPKRKLDRSLI